jgi:hypothetical protein
MYDANVRLRHFVRLLYVKLANVPEKAILRGLHESLRAQDLIQVNFPSGVVMTITETAADATQSGSAGAPSS